MHSSPVNRQETNMQRRATIAAAVLGLTLADRAPAQMGPNLDLSWSTIDSGGGTSTGGIFTLTGTIGQPDAGTMSGGGFQLSGGFWAGGSPMCYADCNASGSLTIADFGCFQAKFAAGDPYADCNHSGSLTIADFGCFQAAFAAGCP
jgi:hypothetical protein